MDFLLTSVQYVYDWLFYGKFITDDNLWLPKENTKILSRFTPSLLERKSSGPLESPTSSTSHYIGLCLVSSHHPSYRQVYLNTCALKMPFDCYIMDESSLALLEETIPYSSARKTLLKALLARMTTSTMWSFQPLGDLLVLQWTPERPQYKIVHTVSTMNISQGPLDKNPGYFQELIQGLERARENDPLTFLRQQDSAYEKSALQDSLKLVEKTKQSMASLFIQESREIYLDKSTQKNATEDSKTFMLAFKFPDGRKLKGTLHPSDSLQYLYGFLLEQTNESTDAASKSQNNSSKSLLDAADATEYYKLTILKGPSWSFQDIMSCKEKSLKELGLALPSSIIFVEPDFQ